MPPLKLLAAAVAAVAGLCLAVFGVQSGGDRPARPAPVAAPTTPTPAPTPHRRRPRTVRVTVGVSGDLLPHMPIVARARALGGGHYDFAPLFRELRPWVRRTDVAICHVETPLTPAAPSGYPVFNSPPALARGIRATGWEACDTASNHTLDQGESGVRATLEALDRAGVRHTGSFRSPRARRRPLMLRAHGVRIAYLAYTATTNGFALPHPWSVNLARARTILRDARRARLAGARAVIVNVHWGTEYQHAPDELQRRLAARLTRSGAITAVVGQHAHVVQPIRRVHGRWVVFGEGNLLSNQTSACCPTASQDGMLVRLHLRIRGRHAVVRRVDYTPTWVRHPDYTVLPIGRALRRHEGDVAALRASWHRTVGVVGRGKRLTPLPPRLP